MNKNFMFNQNYINKKSKLHSDMLIVIIFLDKTEDKFNYSLEISY